MSRSFTLGILSSELGRDVAERVGDDEHLRVAVVEDVRGLLGVEVPVDARVEEARALRGPAHLEELGPVLHEHRDVIAEAQPRVVEALRELVRAIVQLAVGDGLPGRGHDVRDLIRPFLRVLSGHMPLARGYGAASTQNVVMTLRMTSPASIARNASLTSSSSIVRDTIDDGVEATGLDEVGEALEVAAHLTRAVLAALQRLLVEEEVEGRDRELRPRRGSCRP